jgi:predicted amidophosphoribosyltransferase
VNNHIHDATKMACPHCGAEKHEPDDEFWTCGSHQDGYRDRPCRQREPLWRELTTLRTANKALVERVKRLELAGDSMEEFDSFATRQAWRKAKEAKP